jgi:hypothetical protein
MARSPGAPLLRESICYAQAQDLQHAAMTVLTREPTMASATSLTLTRPPRADLAETLPWLKPLVAAVVLVFALLSLVEVAVAYVTQSMPPSHIISAPIAVGLMAESSAGGRHQLSAQGRLRGRTGRLDSGRPHRPADARARSGTSPHSAGRASTGFGAGARPIEP